MTSRLTAREATHFREKLLRWYDENPRPLPWKSDKDPYKIWLSEIILQQTQVSQGLPYYLHFIEAYPTVRDLADASTDEVMKSWEGLGYYSRVRNLHAAAKFIANERDGVFPDDYTGLLELKGVGPYTAAAIASFAYDLPHAVIDGNVYRVLSRYFGVYEAVDTTIGKKIITQLADQLISRDIPAAYNQAIMNFGALVCKPKAPVCHTCPLSNRCRAKADGSTDLLPIKSKRLIRKQRYFHYLIIIDGDNTYVEKRGVDDIWKSLYQFPILETSGVTPITSLQNWMPGYDLHLNKPKTELKQTLTHQEIHGLFYIVRDFNADTLPDSWVKKPISSLDTLAFPKMIRTFISDYF